MSTQATLIDLHGASCYTGFALTEEKSFRKGLMPLDTSSFEDIISEKKSLRLAKISLNYENDALPLFYTHGALVLRYMMCTEE